MKTLIFTKKPKQTLEFTRKEVKPDPIRRVNPRTLALTNAIKKSA